LSLKRRKARMDATSILIMVNSPGLFELFPMMAIGFPNKLQ
jgi:hypothetical protein